VRTPRAQQEQPPHQGPPVRILTHAEALLPDARSYAAEFNVSIDEAVRRLRAQEQQGDVIERLRNATRSRLAGLWREHKPEFRLVVRLVGNAPAPPEFQAAAAGSPTPVVFVTGAAATQAELLDKIHSSLPMFKAALPGLTGTDVDVKTGEIVLTVYAVGAAGEAAKTKGAELGKQLGHPVRIDLIDAPERNAHTRGGANLSTCTSGFVVANSAGTRGVLTAGHCNNLQTYYEFGGTSYAMTFVDEIDDADQDVQWHTTTHDEYPEFYADLTTSARILTGRRLRSSTAIGDAVCHRGLGSGYSCGSVQSTTYQPIFGACNVFTCTSTYIKVSGPNLACTDGDSGGPFFNGQTAFGIMKTGSFTGSAPGQCNFATYMSTDYISGLGVSLVYGP
jgi:hypothetical protein